MGARSSRGLIVGAIALVILGIALLLNNFLLIEGFNVAALLPLILVLAGAAILLRGDLLPSDGGKAFGITRGSVESGVIEVSAGAIDVGVRALAREGRLIAGQFAADTRPALVVDEHRAHLRFDRSATPWLAFNDWSLELARDLPWSLFVTASLGHVNVDCSGLVLESGVLASAFGGIRFVCPMEAIEPIRLRSTLAPIRVITPDGVAAEITINGPRMLGVRFDTARYSRTDEGAYVTTGASDGPPVRVSVSGTFGDVYLA